MARFLSVKNWRSYQHYSDRRPPWIKLYVALLDDLEYLDMSDGAQAGLIRIWLLAARLGHPLPNNPKLIEQRAGVKVKYLREIVAHGWLLETDEQSASPDASNPASTDASTLTRARERADARSREGEREGEREREQTTAEDGGAVLSVFEVPEHDAAYRAYRVAHRFPSGLDASLRAVHSPSTGGEGYSWSVIGAALLDMQGNGTTFSVAALRGFCRRIVHPPAAPAVPGTDRAAARRRALEIAAARERQEATA